MYDFLEKKKDNEKQLKVIKKSESVSFPKKQKQQHKFILWKQKSFYI